MRYCQWEPNKYLWGLLESQTIYSCLVFVRMKGCITRWVFIHVFLRFCISDLFHNSDTDINYCFTNLNRYNLQFLCRHKNFFRITLKDLIIFRSTEWTDMKSFQLKAQLRFQLERTIFFSLIFARVRWYFKSINIFME